MCSLIKMISRSNGHNRLVQVPLVYQNAFMLLLSIVYYFSLSVLVKPTKINNNNYVVIYLFILN